ncbi:MAG: hypothetical protein AVDCRST_MAG85-3100 [uncultured Solirubrobacteraceae bacterium]|uniref:DUF1440 domain-containing protein n=1 Tax=uncultured Solirubrobacteraceae bacterium TaxID=1162706 RepID=A0A6J4TIG8_9ACTN|nr:MAG: hypothetical protein AVDCRST_MAG85-3100 [uncultured Solirubrobacteraceae bacterium]
MIAGLAGVAVMTAWQKLVEMPITGRAESYEPANLLMRVLPIAPKRGAAKRRLNNAAHFGVGLGWGAAHAAIARRRGLRGQRAVATVFVTLWPGDVATTVALGLNAPPWRWTRRDLAIDVADKLVLAQATGAVYDRLRGGPAGTA